MAPASAHDAVERVLLDLALEHQDLAALVADLDEAAWRSTTPADGWDVADSISHLWFFDTRAALAIRDHEGFARDTAEMMANFAKGGDPSVARGRAVSGAHLFADWRADSAALVAVGRAADASVRVPWYGPSMSLASFLTARLMETWAHGVDVADALGKPVVASDRLKHVCHIGVLARPNSYRARNLPVPEADIAVRLVAPDGSTWTWGNHEAPESIDGTALDFALLVTQRRHVDDTALVATGAMARQWTTVAQAFAGPAGPGRQPR
ncbi:MAG: TIGR03084 family protein [Actinobacteria bacterium]|nr:TIGR03084 family protein [Actinomycetota bacterium]